MNNYVKVEWRLRLKRLNNYLAAWHKQTDTALREWAHLSEIGLHDVYHRILYTMIKEVENLEDEIMKRRLLEDEIHKLKHELTDIKYPPDSVQNPPRSFQSIPPLQLSPRGSDKGSTLRSTGSTRSSIISIGPLNDRETETTLMSPTYTGLIHVSPRRKQEETRKRPQITMSPDVNNRLFDPKPTTIAKDFKALLDSEWTKLYADMRRFYLEQYVVDLLLAWLKDCYVTCIAITEDQRENIREGVLKCFSRYISVCVRRLVSGEENAEYPLQYIKRCAELCWLMCAQDPPMSLYMDVVQGELINRKLFTSLIPRGEAVEYLVWPPVMRYARGHLLQRGVVKTVS